MSEPKPPQLVPVTYAGPMADGVDVAFPTRSVYFPQGDAVDLSQAEAAALATHPDFTPAPAGKE